jgi:2-keto-4-pentenoate hydratase/2-oxohepta-3-ene-1,7-dioic acid hydratase in catechol pathway
VGALAGGDRVIDLADAARALRGDELPGPDLRAIVEGGGDARRAVEAIVRDAAAEGDAPWAWDRDHVTFHHPYRPRKNIVRAGGNVDREPDPSVATVELPPGRWLRGFPLTYYSKSPSAVVDPEQPISWPLRVASNVYAEPQLVIVVGETIHYADPQIAMDAVFGYAVATDVISADLKVKHGQWVKAVSLDTFFPWGPTIVTADEVADPDSLEVTLSLGEDEVIAASTADALYTVADMLSELSQGMRLDPGDLLMLGVPDCVGFGEDPPRWLSAGDTVTSSIEGVGTITNTVEPT